MINHLEIDNYTIKIVRFFPVIVINKTCLCLFQEQIETLSGVEEECLNALEGAGLESPMTSRVHVKCMEAKHRPKC